MVICYSVAQSCLTFWGPMDCSTPGFPVLHHLSELAQTHIHRISDAIQLSHPLSARSQHEELHPWQRSWGRRLWHMQRWDRASGNPLFLSICPQNQSLPTLLLYALTYTWLYGGLSPTTSLGEGVNLQLQLIKIPGHDKSVSTYKLLWKFCSLPDRFIWPHVIVHSLPTVRGTRCFKLSKYRLFWEVRKLLVYY